MPESQREYAFYSVSCSSSNIHNIQYFNQRIMTAIFALDAISPLGMWIFPPEWPSTLPRLLFFVWIRRFKCSSQERTYISKVGVCNIMMDKITK